VLSPRRHHGAVTLTRRQVQEMIAERALRPSRALGQNFVADPNTVRRIARLAELEPDQKVVEIGAGLGALTLALADTGARVTAVEIDQHLLPVLRAQVEGHGVRVVHADALTLDWSALLTEDDDAGQEEPSPWVLVANLPYNVAVPVIVRVLDEAPAVASMLVMVQREVGARLAAGPGTKAYGAVSVKVAYHATARLVGRVPPAVFIPRPNVESVLVQLVRRPVVAVDPAVVAPERLFTVVRAGFAHRRKMLRRALADVIDPAAFAAVAIDPAARAEELSIEEWGRLVAFADKGDRR
jgi:16S rRNA (adenine1518-N6/adenine1519-N6)-dimethyltransferase